MTVFFLLELKQGRTRTHKSFWDSIYHPKPLSSDPLWRHSKQTALEKIQQTLGIERGDLPSKQVTKEDKKRCRNIDFVAEYLILAN